ncbi:MAG: 1-(5-phosphoribosyl)-5-[(5-phosphoribosylamino)methylideneamino]imidazole-4-carboxamide isomerase [Acidobacteriaceae bacterium]
MLIPSIDLMGGRVVQLVHGEDLALGFDDLDYWVERFAGYPLIQMIDLDAAKRQGNNRQMIERIVQRLPCQVGGGIRSSEDAHLLLGLGAKRVIFGSALFGPPDALAPSAARSGSAQTSGLTRLHFAEQLAESVGIDSLVFSVDTKKGRVAVRGWREQIALRPEVAMRELEPFCGTFLYTNIDTEGTMQGFPVEVAHTLRQHTLRNLIVAGGIRHQSEIDLLDTMHIDAVAGMAIYSGVMHA